MSSILLDNKLVLEVYEKLHPIVSSVSFLFIIPAISPLIFQISCRTLTMNEKEEK